MKKKIWFSAIGASILGILTAWLGPKFLTWWWFTPSLDNPLNCNNQVRDALTYFQRTQLAALVVGGLLGLVASFMGKGSSTPELD